MQGDLIEIAGSRRTSLRDLSYILFRHKWRMLLFFIAALAGTAIFSFSAANIFRSEAKLLVRLGRESVTLDPTVTTGQTLSVVASRESEVITELEILKSRKMAEKVVDSIGPKVILRHSADKLSDIDGTTPTAGDKIGLVMQTVTKKLRALLERSSLYEPMNDHDKAVLAIMKNSEIATEKDTSNIITLDFEAESPELARRVLTTLVDAYLEEHVAVHTTRGSYEFFTEQSNLLRTRLGDLEDKLQKIGNGTSISSINEEIRVTLDRIGNLEREVDRTESSAAASRAKVQELRESLAAMPQTVVTSTTTGFPNRAAEAMRERLYELQLKEQDLLSKYSEESRQVQEIRRQIAEAQVLMRDEEPVRAQTTKALNTARQQAESALLTEQTSLSSLEAETSELKGNLAEARAHLRSLNDTATDMKRLKREIDMQEANYLKYTQNLEQARIDHALNTDRISNITVIQPATIPVKPVRPHRMLQLLLGCFFGFFGAIVLAFASEYFNHTIRAPREVEEKLRLLTLAYVPRTRANTIRPAVKWHFFSRNGGKSEDEAPALWDIPSKVKGHYDVLSERIISGLNGSARSLRLLAITGLQRGEGVSAVAANLASALSRATGARVLLVDANFTSPSQHKIFRVESTAGLANVLSNGNTCADVTFASPVENLSLMPAGSINGDGNLAEVVKPDKLARLLKHLKKDYRYVIVDMPAIEEVNWAVRVAGQCDGVGLVVEAEKCRWETVQAAKERLLMSKANVLGVILTKRRFPVPRWLYEAL
jgi:capsular exopolysaccharide synthesis family protein